MKNGVYFVRSPAKWLSVGEVETGGDGMSWNRVRIGDGNLRIGNGSARTSNSGHSAAGLAHLDCSHEVSFPERLIGETRQPPRPENPDKSHAPEKILKRR